MLRRYLFDIQMGEFTGEPGDSVWKHDIQQHFTLFVEAENLSEANKELERRFGSYERCRYKFIKEDD